MDDEPEYGPVEMLRSARQHLEIYDGLVALFDNPHAMLDVVLGAEDMEHAMQLLCENFDINLAQADVVLSWPFLHLTTRRRAVVHQSRVATLAQIAELEAELAAFGGEPTTGP